MTPEELEIPVDPMRDPEFPYPVGLDGVEIISSSPADLTEPIAVYDVGVIPESPEESPHDQS